MATRKPTRLLVAKQRNSAASKGRTVRLRNFAVRKLFITIFSFVLQPTRIAVMITNVKDVIFFAQWPHAIKSVKRDDR